METVSEITRGRPPAFHPEYLREMASVMAMGDKSKRAIQNNLYALEGMRPLMVDGSIDMTYHWLVEDNGAYRVTILAELGRLRKAGTGDDELRDLAARICKAKLPTRDTVAKLRRQRVGKSAAADPKQLAMEIIETINDYGYRHDLNRHTMRKALELAGLVVASEAVAD